MAYTGAGRGKVKFSDPFFWWLRYQTFMVEDYTYVGTKFSCDPNLSLPPGGQWSDLGKKQKNLKWK